MPGIKKAKPCAAPPAHLLESDGLGVAAALDVEHTAVAPAVLIVTNERAGRVGRQRGLAGACRAWGQKRAVVAGTWFARNARGAAAALAGRRVAAVP